MRAYLEFELPEERVEFNTHINGIKYYSVLWDLDQWLHEKMDRGGQIKINIEEVKEKLFVLCEQAGFDLYGEE